MKFLLLIILWLLLLALPSGCGIFPHKREAATLPREEITQQRATSQEEARLQTAMLHKWCEYWIPFFSEYNGALIELEVISRQLIQKHDKADIHTKLARIDAKLKNAETNLGLLPPIDGLTKKHQVLLDENATRARSALSAAQEIPAMLFALAENPEDSILAQALTTKLAEANEFLACNENVINIRNELLNHKHRSHLKQTRSTTAP